VEEASSLRAFSTALSRETSSERERVGKALEELLKEGEVALASSLLCAASGCVDVSEEFDSEEAVAAGVVAAASEMVEAEGGDACCT
jgi:hypothetical protein